MNIVTPLLTTYRRLTWAFSFIGNHQNPERSRTIPQNRIHNDKHTTRNTTRFFAFMMTTCLLLVIGVGSVSATTYYSSKSNSPNTLSHWWTNTNGTGSNPRNFTTAGDVFTIQNGNSMSLGNDWTVTGNVIINDGGTLVVGAHSLTIGGTTTVGNGTSGALNITSTTGTETFTGLVTINAGGTWNNSENESITFQGGITNNGTFNAGTGVQTFNANNQALTGTFSIPKVTITGVTLTNNNSLTVGTALSGNGGLTQAANATLNIGGTSSITTLTATATGNTVNYTGTSQTINSNNYYNLTLSGGGTDVLQTGTTNIGGNFTTSGSVKVAAVTGLTIAGNVILGSGTTFTAGAFTHNVAGNWTNNGGTCTSTGSTINFNGTAAQTIGGSASTTFNNLTINNSAGVALSAATTVSGTVTLTSGILTTTTTNLLSVTNTATTAISGGFSNSTFINGPVKWTLPANLVSGSTYNYPVGSGTTYLPFALVNPTTGTGTITTQIQAFNTSSGGTYDATLTSISSLEYWSLTTTGNFTNSSVSLTRQSAITPLNTIGVSTTSNGTYTYLGGTAGTNGVTGSNTVSGNSDFFVLAKAAGTSFWYKADGTTPFDGTTWHDETTNSNNATVLTTGTGTVALANNTINFNPSLTFTNVSRQMLTNSTANVQSFVVVTLPARSSTNTNLNSDYAGLIGAASDDGIRLDATGYIWSGNATNSGTGIGLNNNDWSYISSTTGISRINGVSGWAFSNWHIVNQTRNAVLNSQYYLGGYYSSPRPYYGSIAEVMAFPGATVPQQNSVETYLGVKYGITLGHDYIAGNGTTVYPVVSSSYANNIAGLGNDNTYGLNQKVSASINIPSGSSRIVMATTNDFTSGNQSGSRTALANGQYLIWGDNGGATTTWTTSGSYYIVSRTWEVQNTGSVGAVNFQIDLTGYPISASGSYALLTATNSTFSSGVTAVPLTNTSGNLYTASITFPAGASYFTITSSTMAAIYVRTTTYGGNNSNDGSSWSKAKATIQNAVEASYALTTPLPVYVAAGSYSQDPTLYSSNADYKTYSATTGANWNGIANTFVIRDSVNVYGGFPENKTTNNNNAGFTNRVVLADGNGTFTTILNGGTNQRVLGTTYAEGVTNHTLTTPVTWDGFTITGASITSASPGDDYCGGGVYAVTNCTINNCIIKSNLVSGGSSGADGAAAELSGATLSNCIIYGNTTGISGASSAGTVNIRGGGTNVINCLIYGNTAYLAGGGISVHSYDNATTVTYIINNTICNNVSTGTALSSGFYSFTGTLKLYNNAFWNNSCNWTSSTVTENYNAWPSDYSNTPSTGSFKLTASPNNTGTNAPYFVSPINTSAADYRLQSTSSALYQTGGINLPSSGTNLVPTTDIRGVFRSATKPEIGCYELASRLYYVNNATGTDTTGYGFNWSNPYKTVQFAITSPQYSQYDFPQVWVAKGTYATTTSYLLQNNMSMYGGFAGNQATEFPTTSAMVTSIRNSRNLKTNQTILSNTSAPIVSYSGTVTNAQLDGFTITGATSGSSAYAVNFPAGADSIQNCKIINNTGIAGGLSLNASNVATNVLIADNSGVGINFAGTSGKVVNATIANNTGVGINSSSSSPTVTNSIVWGNSANLSGTTPTITYSAAASNYGAKPWPTGTGYTGNIDLLQRTPNFKNLLNNVILNRNYELLLISPCLSQGSASANTLVIDANGKPRTYSSTIDMGAFEKWDGVTVSGSTVSNVRTGTTYTTSTLSSAVKDSLEICVKPNTVFNMGGTSLKAHWLELMQDTVSTHLPAQLTNGTITADSVLYVRRFSKTLSGTNGIWGVWTFFGIPFGTAPLSALDGAIDENTVRIETYSENARAKNGIGYAWPAGRLIATSTMNQGTGYAFSFNSKVPQNDIGQTVIFSSPALSPVTFTETSTPTASVTLGETPSATSGRPYWYDCGWNLIANPLPQTAGINTMWASTSQSYYGAAYFYKPYTDNYDVYPTSMLATTSSAIAPNAAFFVQTDVDGATATFTAGAGTGTPLVNMDFVRPVLSSNATDATTASNATVQPATFQFKVTGGGDYCNTFVIFDPGAHADMEPMEDNPTMEGVTAQPALQLSTTATGSTISLAINRLPFTGSTMQVPMQVYAPIAGSYTITMPVSDTIAETVLLQDTTGAIHNLTTGGYTFTTTTDGVTNNYTLIFSGTSTATLVAKGVTIVQDQRNVIVSSTSTMQQVALYGEAGQTYYLQNPSSTQVTLQLPPTPGIYLIKVVTAEGVITKKLVNRQ